MRPIPALLAVWAAALGDVVRAADPPAGAEPPPAAGAGLAPPEDDPGPPWRDRLAESGVSFELTYMADFFVNARGGLNAADAFQYRGLLDVGITVETEPLGLWPGGQFYVEFLDTHGIDISERHVGDIQALNNADGLNASRVYEAWFEQTVLDGGLRIRLGKQDVNLQFAAPVGPRGEFVNSSSGFSPTIPMVTWPDTAWAATVFVEPVEWLYVGAGIYDALGTSTRVGLDTTFHAPDETFSICELGVRPTLSLFGRQGLAGQYAIGTYYHSGRWLRFRNDLDGRLPERFATGNSGVYVTADQQLHRETDDAEDAQGLGAFFQFGWAPGDRNEIHQHFGGGVHYVGLIPGRDEDVVGFAAQHVNLSGIVQELEDRHSETALELFYRAQLTPWLSVKPDVQYIVNPGGAGRDALVAGVRLEFAF